MPNLWLARSLALVLFALAGGTGLAERAVAAPSDGSPIGVPPDRVVNVSADFFQGVLLLAWNNPPTLDWAETIVRGAPGTTPPATSTQGFGVYAGKDATSPVYGLEAGTPYAFALFARDLEGLEASPATVKVSAAKVTMLVNPARVINGGIATFTINVRDVITGKPLANREIGLFGRRPGSEEIVQFDSARTTGKGKAFIRLRPPENFGYAAVYFGEGYNIGGYSADLHLPVALLVKAKPSARIVGVGQIFSVVTTVDPATSGRVVLEELIRGEWTKIATRKLNAAGKATFRFNANARGTHTYRFRTAGTKRYGAGTSKPVTITAR